MTKGKTLAIYLMAGGETPDLAAAAEAGGADLVEIGFPFSDPLADGPVIRRAAERALANGMRTRACLECLAKVRDRVSVPLVPMTYSSLLEAYGWNRFAADIRAKVANAVQEIMHDPDIVQKLKELGAVAKGTSAAEFAAFMRSDYDKWGRVIRDTGIKLSN